LTASFARESLQALKDELDKGLLQELLNQLSITVSYTLTSNKKRQIGGNFINFTLSPCDSPNISQAMNLTVTMGISHII
jgi:hypothetical protein